MTQESIPTWQERMPTSYGDGAYLYLQKTAMQAEIDDLRAALHVTVVCGYPNPLTAWRNGCYARYEAMKSILSHEEKLVILAFIDGA